MFGASIEIMKSQFILQNKEKLYEQDLFMYIMDTCLHHPQNHDVVKDKSLFENLLYTADKKISKYENLQKVRNNVFLTSVHRDNYAHLFSLSQKTYLAFSRLAFIWKYKRAVRGNTMDMMMNDICPEERGVVEVYQHGSVYLFRTQEINRIVENSVCETEYMFASPKAVKNPFNNLPFSKANLYTMYFGIEKMFVSKLPVIFYNYFRADFNLHTFYQQNHALIREKGIQDYLKNSETDDLYDDVFNMLEYVKSYSGRRFNLDISEDCCKCCIVKIMKPYLKLYLTHRHSLDKYVSRQSFYELRHKLFKLLEYNPAFGRKIRVKNRTGLDGKITFKPTINLKHPCNHIPFNKDEYKKTHLDTTFIDQDDYPVYEHINDYEIERPIALMNPSRLHNFVHATAFQHLRFDEDNTENSSTSSDSDDATVVASYAPPTVNGSDTEEGEVTEDSNVDNEDDSSTELDFTLDYTGDTSMNDLSAIPSVNDTNDIETNLNELAERIEGLCTELEREFEDDPDSREDQFDC